MATNDALFYVIQEFNKKESYLGPDKVMTRIWVTSLKNWCARFSESYNEEAGAHFTSRDIIYLMTDLLLAEDRDLLAGTDVVRQFMTRHWALTEMLSAMIERIHSFNADAEVGRSARS